MGDYESEYNHYIYSSQNVSLVKFSFYEPSCSSCKLMKFHKTEFPMHLELVVWKEHSCTNSQNLINAKDFMHNQGAKKVIFTACHLSKLKLAFTSPSVISTSPQNFLMSRIDFTVLLLVEYLKIRVVTKISSCQINSISRRGSNG